MEDRHLLTDRFWRHYVRVYDLIWDSPATAQIREVIGRELGRPELAIDLGCGTGLMSRGLRELGISVIGVDSEPRMVARALTSRRIGCGMVAAAESVPLPSKCADAVIISAVLHLHPDPTAVLDEAMRLLRDDGVVLIASPRSQLSPALVHAADVSSGRGRFRSLLAHVLRIWIGIVASFSDGEVAARSRGDAEVDVAARLEALQAQHPDLGLTKVGLVAGLQNVWVLRRSAARA